MKEKSYIWRAARGAELVHKARDCGQYAVVIKTRDGSKPINHKHMDTIAKACSDTGVALELWAWLYPRDDGDRGGRAYVLEAMGMLLDDSTCWRATAVELNLEAPWSWATNHKWAAGHEAAWGSARERREEMELRARLLAKGTSVCTFPYPRNHSVPFGIFADGHPITPMAYSGDLAKKMATSRAQWAELGATITSWAVPCTPKRGPEGVRSARAAAAPGDMLVWWSLDQADSATVAELARGVGG